MTDRRRLALSQQRPLDEADTLLVEQIAGAARGGIDLVQIREPDLESGALAALVRRALARVAGTRARIVVNDRVDVAIAAGAHGVHLRDDSVPTGDVRSLIGTRALIGRSIHRVEDVARAGEVDYLIAGTVFATASKPGAQLLGVDGLRRVVAAADQRPVFAIGGMSIANLQAVEDAGARGAAAIGLFIPVERSPSLLENVETITKRVRFCFDTPVELP